ncbi:MAG: two-component regulator propeller domain-containing protein, partial [Anaerolineales bacterium]
MWFATEGGLDKYDGYQFTVYKHDPDNSKTLSDNLVQTIYLDRQGKLWIGTSTGLDRFDSKTDSFLHYSQDLAGSAALKGQSISVIFQDRSGTLWVGTDGGGLAALNLTTNQSKIYKHSPEDLQSLSGNSINAIYEDKTGELWIGTDAGLDYFDSITAKFALSFGQPVVGSPFVGNVGVFTIAEDEQGALWIGTVRGLFEWNRSKNQLTEYNHDTNIPESLSDDSVTCILEDSKGELWFGTRKGLDLFDKTQNRFINYVHDPNDPNSLASDSIRSIYEDRSDVLWIGTSGGLNKYARATQKFAFYQHNPNLPNSLSDNNVWSIYEDHLGSLWVGTFSAGLDRLDPNTGAVTVYQNKPGDPTSLSSNEIRAILEDHNGKSWVGMERGGLDRFDPGTGTFTSYRHNSADPNSLSNDDVFSIFEDRLGKLWIGTQHGGLNRLDQATGTFTHYQHDASDPESLSDDQVRAIIEDHTGVLWIGTFGGLDLWDGQTNRFTVYRSDPRNPSSLSSDEVSCIFEDPNGTVWVGTFGGGLNRFDRTTRSFTHYNEKNGLPDDTVYGILADPGGDLWLSTNKGLSKFDPGTKIFRNYDISDGLQGDQFNPGSFFQSKDGEMFYGGTQGLNAFYPAQVVDNPIPPPLVITAFQKFNQTVQTDLASNETVQLSYRDSFISFEFAALDYNAPGKNQYAYMLEGVDQGWVYAGTRRYASYTNLRGGNYTFRVKATNNDGIWNSEGIEIRIHITPPFWQTWWFIGIACLVAGAGAFGGYRLRVKDIQGRNRELAKRVQQRTSELTALNSIATVVNGSLNLNEILNSSLDQMLALLHLDIGLAFRLEEQSGDPTEGPVLRLLAHRGLSDEYVRSVQSLPLQSTMVGPAAEKGAPVVWDNANYPTPAIQAANEKEGVRLGISIPLLVKGSLVGSVSVGSREARVMKSEELSLLAAIGLQVGMAVVNARLYEQAEQTAITTERSRLAR